MIRLLRGLNEIFDGVADVIASLAPSCMALEELFSHYKRPRTSILMGHARGVICLAAARAGIPVTSYAATRIKKTLTGNGQAAKPQMQRAVARELGLAAPPEPHDVADALAAALCHFYMQPEWAAVARDVALDFTPCTATTTELLVTVITKITGKLLSVAEDVATLRFGAFDFEVFIPEFARRQLQHRTGEEISLHTIGLFGREPDAGAHDAALIGFLSEVEREFFELFCSVDGVGVKKALRAMIRPVREVATAIEEQDTKVLSSLPGVGPATAERIIASCAAKCRNSRCWWRAKKHSTPSRNTTWFKRHSRS